jgi:hypothetical protein
MLILFHTTALDVVQLAVYAFANIEPLLATYANPVAAQSGAGRSRRGSARMSLAWRDISSQTSSNPQALPDGGQILAW